MEDVWYSGLRTVEQRAVNRDDALIIDDLKHDRLFRLVLAVAGPPLLLAFGFVAAYFTNTGEPIVLAGSAATFFAVALCPWRTVPAFARQLSALRRDLEIGEVLICKGQGRELVFTLGPEQRLEPAALVRGSRDQPLEVEILSESGAILRINGTPLDSWSQTEKGGTAAKSEHARLAAQFVSPHPEQEGVGVGERPLSSDELGELFAHATPLTRVDIALLLAVAGLVALSWWYAVASHATNLALPILSTIAFVWLAFRALRRWRIYRRFAGDLRYGHVAIVSFENGSSIVEFLPFSGFVWSENHVAAPWRRLPLLRKTFSRRRGA